MMSESIFRILTFIAGLILGVIFFGGLWLTVKKTATAKNPALWFLGSLILRSGVILVGFYYISNGIWQRLLICLVGFIAARYLVIHFTGLKEKQLHQKKEGGYES